MNIINDEAVEIWRDVVGFSGYQVSSLGRIKSLERFARRGKGTQFVKERILRLALNSYGYHCVSLCLNDTTHRTRTVHQIVALAFIPNPFGKLQVNHIDGVKINNIVSNLEWATAKENVDHASRNGLLNPVYGSKNHNSKLSEMDVSIIKSRLAKADRQSQIANDYEVSTSTINDIKFGRSWNHVP